MKTYKSIAKVLEAVRSGELDEKKLEVRMDNDCSSIYYDYNEESDDNDPIFRGEGYADCDPLWRLLFPKANVDWV